MTKSRLIMDGYEFDLRLFLKFLQKIGVFIQRDENILHIFGDGQNYQLEGDIANFFQDSSSESMSCPFTQRLRDLSFQIQKLEAQISLLSLKPVERVPMEYFNKKNPFFNESAFSNIASNPLKKPKPIKFDKNPQILNKSPLDKKTCLGCGNPVSPNTIFCTTCGRPQRR